jgi:transcriptional regulator with XRE-family HTH domain
MVTDSCQTLAIVSAVSLPEPSVLAGSGQRLRELRERCGMSQTDFGARVGVSAQTVISWEKGRTHPKRSKLNLIARALDVVDQEISHLFLSPSESNVISLSTSRRVDPIPVPPSPEAQLVQVLLSRLSSNNQPVSTNEVEVARLVWEILKPNAPTIND